MSNRLIQKSVRMVAIPGRWILDKLGYRFDGICDKYVRTNLCIRTGQEDGRHREFVSAWMTMLLVGIVFFVILLVAGLRFEAAYMGMLPIVSPVFVLKASRAKALSARRQISMDMPQIIGLLTILLNTGLSLSSAIGGIVRAQGDKRILNRYLAETLNAVDRGVPLATAWTGFANKCSTSEASALATLIIRENTLGAQGIVDSLRSISQSSEQTRRRQVLKAGEVARTRLLIPQTMIFACILLLIGYPAFVALGGVV